MNFMVTPRPFLAHTATAHRFSAGAASMQTVKGFLCFRYRPDSSDVGGHYNVYLRHVKFAAPRTAAGDIERAFVIRIIIGPL